MLGGVVIDRLGGGWTTAHAVNLAGLAALLALGWLLELNRGRSFRPAIAASTVAEQRREPAALA